MHKLSVSHSIFAILAICILVLCIPCHADQTSQSSAPKDELEKSLDNLCEQYKGPADTIKQLLPQIKAKPDDLELRLKYADALMQNKNYKEALAEYRKVRDKDKNNSHAILGTAYCYDAQGDTSLALAECKSACDRNFDDPDTVLTYIIFANKHGKLGDSLPALHTLAKFQPIKAAPCYWMIAAWMVEKDYWKAQPYAKEAHNLDPKAFPSDGITAKPLDINWGNGGAIFMMGRFSGAFPVVSRFFGPPDLTNGSMSYTTYYKPPVQGSVVGPNVTAPSTPATPFGLP
jgi:tetratricopeptide (TPR) repeat protein